MHSSSNFKQLCIALCCLSIHTMQHWTHPKSFQVLFTNIPITSHILNRYIGNPPGHRANSTTWPHRSIWNSIQVAFNNHRCITKATCLISRLPITHSVAFLDSPSMWLFAESADGAGWWRSSRSTISVKQSQRLFSSQWCQWVNKRDRIRAHVGNVYSYQGRMRCFRGRRSRSTNESSNWGHHTGLKGWCHATGQVGCSQLLGNTWALALQLLANLIMIYDMVQACNSLHTYITTSRYSKSRVPKTITSLYWFPS
jgi:hypothetical protein